jgi:hypothetical protein
MCSEDLVYTCTNSPGHLRQLGVSSADMKLLVPAFYRTYAVGKPRPALQATGKLAISPVLCGAHGGEATEVELELLELEVRFTEVYQKTLDNFNDHNPLMHSR